MLRVLSTGKARLREDMLRSDCDYDPATSPLKVNALFHPGVARVARSKVRQHLLQSGSLFRNIYLCHTQG
jgi:hypothetical protein